MANAPRADVKRNRSGAELGQGIARRSKRNLAWDSALPECEIGDYQVVPLTSSRQLRAEGREMKHCVARYADLCFRGLARVFSIRDLFGHRVATASLIWRNDYWHLEQVKGVMNGNVLDCVETFFDGESTMTAMEPTDLYFVSQTLLQSYRSAWEERNRENLRPA